MIRSSVFTLATFVSTAAFAQGSFDFSRIEGLPDEPTVQIDLPAEMLGFVTEAARSTDPAAAEALSGIRGVRVLVYEELETTASLLDTFENTSRMLENEGWQRMVYVNEEEDKVRMYAKLGAENLQGMTVMVLGEEEAVFVNIDGIIEPATLGHLANQFGMGGMLDDITGLSDGPPTPPGGPNPGADPDPTPDPDPDPDSDPAPEFD